MSRSLGKGVGIRKYDLEFTFCFSWCKVSHFRPLVWFMLYRFSGDWSRIGVLSKETEEELQWAAIGVVPLAATLIWSIYKRNRDLWGELRVIVMRTEWKSSCVGLWWVSLFVTFVIFLFDVEGFTLNVEKLIKYYVSIAFKVPHIILSEN
jgi:hypothetical protein